MYRLYTFSQPNGEREFVVISDRLEQEVRQEYETDGFTTDNVIMIDDAIGFPCDRPLRV